nr:immunoglobulin heavy chain junction region [Macaca mulatta]MOX14611.1 immunoglobulin heavy chain junction region [Macaca mulatta]MOX14696.1 immunoglobulin heavy chain junction region [Macaca mulatta]MOX14755.1 immunoglobulin heavy chain junction region [Macaca mulatta]MOX14812.1 immunoglobulin heavy chain junction region [Macaca mulatta]
CARHIRILYWLGFDYW